MKRVFLVLSFLVLFTFLCVTNVSASECSLKELRELKTLAKKVQVTYEFDEKYKNFSLSVYNLNDKIAFSTGMNAYSKDTKNFDYLFSLSKNSYYIYATKKTNCKDELLHTIRITTPYYNPYSEKKECISNYKLNVCKKWYDTSNIEEEEFKKIINENNKEEKQPTFLENVVNFFRQHYISIIVVVLILILIVIGVKIYNKKNKKLNI